MVSRPGRVARAADFVDQFARFDGLRVIGNPHFGPGLVERHFTGDAHQILVAQKGNNASGIEHIAQMRGFHQIVSAPDADHGRVT